MANEATPELLPVRPAAAIEADPQHAGWLIEGLWTQQGVGLIGGAPKCCKTWLALDLIFRPPHREDFITRVK